MDNTANIIQNLKQGLFIVQMGDNYSLKLARAILGVEEFNKPRLFFTDCASDEVSKG